jgi:hypothetical protein
MGMGAIASWTDGTAIAKYHLLYNRLASTKSTHMTGTDANYPDLSIRVTGFKSIASSNFTLIDLKGSGFEVDRHNLPMIAFFDLRSHL